MKVILKEVTVVKLPTNKLPTIVGVFVLAPGIEHKVEACSFKADFDYPTMDRDLFINDLRETIARDMEVEQSDVLIDKDDLLLRMRLFRWQ